MNFTLLQCCVAQDVFTLTEFIVHTWLPVSSLRSQRLEHMSNSIDSIITRCTDNFSDN